MTDTGPDWLDGAIDLHVHAAPSFFPRWGDAVAVAEACAAAGMAGLLLKAHEGSTTESASVLSRTHAPLRVAGGVVLNRYVGGVNPAAAEAAIVLGARCLWLPTIDSDDHVRAYGTTGAFSAQRGGAEGGTPIQVTDRAGNLRPETREILALARDHGVALATGHVGAQAIEAVVGFAEQLRFDRLVLQHPCFATPALSLEAIERAARRGAFVELTSLSVSPMWRDTTVAACARVFARVGSHAVIVSSDAGQRHSPSPPEALRSFAQCLHESGVSVADVRRAITSNPAQVLGW